MTNRLTIEILKAVCNSLQYLTQELHGVIDDFESRGEEKQEPVKEPEQERHRWLDVRDRGEINHLTWRVVAFGFYRNYDIEIKNLCIEDLSIVTEPEMMKWRGMGKVTMYRVKHVMDAYGVKFKGEE